MKINKFEDIIAWQKARELTIQIYKLSNSLKDFGFRDQIQRASMSIMNNIAEGFERSSNVDFKRFLFIAKASSAEVRSMLSISVELRYFDQSNYQTLNKIALEINYIISALIKSL